MTSLSLAVDQKISKAKSLEKRGRFDDADNLYSIVLENYPSNKRAKSARVKLHDVYAASYLKNLLKIYQQGDFDSVITKSQKLLLKLHHAPSLINILGAAKLAKCEFVEAETFFKRSLELNSICPDALNNLGIALQKQSKFTQSISAFEQAIKVRPKFSCAYFNLGNTFRKIGRINDSIDLYKTALIIEPKNFDALLNLGISLRELRKFDQAIEQLNLAIELKPSSAEAINALGVIYSDLGQSDKAINYFVRAITLAPLYAVAFNNLGCAYKAKSDFQNAKINFKNAISLQSDFADAHYNYGSILHHEEQIDEALNQFQKAVEIDPTHHMASHMKSAITGANKQNGSPEYVKILFDSAAEQFDDKLVNTLQYRTHKTLVEIALGQSTTKSLGKIADLGCGTGLLGQELVGHFDYLEGVDLSSAMLEKAHQRGIYSRLVESELEKYLSTSMDFDYFFAADVFVYIGDLIKIFDHIKNNNSKRCCLIFSTELIQGNGFKLEKSGRYSHSHSYIENLIEKLSFKLLYFCETELRQEKNNMIKGGVYILQIN